MKNQKLFSLALAGALSITQLAGCGSPGGGVSPTPTPTPLPTESVIPSENPTVTTMPIPTPSESAAPEVTPLPPANPDEGVTVSPEPADPSQPPQATEVIRPEAPSQQPAESPKPSETPAPSDTPAPEASAVQSVWNQVSGLERPELMDIDSALLSDLYGIDSADVVEFIGKMPMITANVTEFVIIQAAPGKADTVKAACESRLETLKGGGQYPANQVLVDNYKLIVNGDYVLFCIDEHADTMAEAFNSYTK